MPTYVPTIGLEIHAELKTATKMFCDCLNDPAEQHPNANTCPICLGHPGTLPVINQAAVEKVLKVGMAIQGEIPAVSKFDRKNYFYPDLPKGYQISQYDLPLVFGGILNGIRVRRVHLEEDTGKLVHAEDGKHSLVDFNRAGVPLMELVTEPDIKNAEQAASFAKELQLILRYLGVSDADMEHGQMRVEVNISLSDSKEKLGTKVEVKNINSFKAVQDSIAYEIVRQEELLGKGGDIVHETRGWDEFKQKTVSQRAKEEAHDYRYFPEPDLPPLDLTKLDLKKIKLDIPELPLAKRVRFEKEFGLKPEQAEILIQDREAANFFEETVSELEAADQQNTTQEIQLIINYLSSDLRGLMMKEGIGFSASKITPENFADLIELISHGKLSSRAAKDILGKMFATGTDPHEIMKEGNLEQVSDEAHLRDIVRAICMANPVAIADYKKGKTNALQFLVGRAMADLKGKGNPGVLQKLFRDELEKS